MKEFDYSIRVKAVTDAEMDASEKSLVSAAREMTSNSYAPYSKFHVGAAILLSNGAVVKGANQENAAFPSGICAERTACYAAGATYPGVGFEAIAIAARGTDGEEVSEPCSPCGACRQALLEYETLSGHDVKVIMVGREQSYILPSVKSLLPFAFINF